MDIGDKLALGTILVFFVVFIFIFVTVEITNEIVEGEVIDAYAEDYYVVVTFDNGETYNINFDSRELDFTVNSELHIKLIKRNWFLWPNNDDVWHVGGYVKVPGD